MKRLLCMQQSMQVCTADSCTYADRCLISSQALFRVLLALACDLH